ncbi:MAG: hypothetical protein ABEI99_01835, partial [Halobaculum sp.]
MDPFLTGLLTSLTYDALKGGVAAAREDSLSDRVESAAETVAANHDALQPSDLTDVWGSDAVADHVERFEAHGEPLPTEELTAVLADHEVERTLGADPEVVVEEFLTAVRSELADDPTLWRRVTLRSIKAGNRDTQAVLNGVEALRAEMEDTVVVSAEALRAFAERDELAGFELLTADDFEAGTVNEQYCWRRAFTLAEVREGYPLDRQRGDDDRTVVSEELLDELEDGGGAVLLGPAGSGKTTVTRIVLSKWDERTASGTIFYRRQGDDRPLDADALEDAISEAREVGPVLIAVEDAARRGSSSVYEVIEEYAGDSSVSFLLNSRETEWSPSSDGMAAYDDDLISVRDDLTRVRMPELDPTEVRRFVDTYQSVTGRSVSVDAELLYEQIHSEAGISPMLLLAYEVPVTEGEEIDPDAADPALVRSVRLAWRVATGNEREHEPSVEVEDGEEALRERLALRVSVLNGAELAVRREFMLADSKSDEEYERIDELLDAMRDVFWFEREGMKYRTHHEYWSVLYLDEHLDNAASEDVARRRFETCLNEMFGLFDSADQRDRLRQYLGETTGLLDGLDEAPQPFADKLVGDVFDLGERRPKLVRLFKQSAYSGIDLPDACSDRARVDAVFSRAEMYRGVGDSDREAAELDRASTLSEELGLESAYVTGNDFVKRGNYALRQGDFETARELYQQALDLARENDNRAGEADSLGN